MRRKTKLLSVLAAGIITVISAVWILPGAINETDTVKERYVNAEDVYETPALTLGNVSGKAGETVVIPVNVFCNDNFANLDATISWNDQYGLVSTMAYMGNANNIGGIVSDYGEDYCLVMINSKDDAAISDGMVAYIDFTIPSDAQNGTVYDLSFGSVDSFRDFNGNELKDTVNVYGGKITVGTPGTTIPPTADPSRTTETTSLSEESIEYHEGCALMLSDGKGNPGDKVTVELTSLCINDMEAMDIIIAWNDPSLELSAVYGAEITGSIDYTSADDRCSFMAVGEHIKDGVLGKFEFTIPADAVPGTVYDIVIDSVNSFSDSGGIEHAGKTLLQGGHIAVTDKSGNAVTTAPRPDDAPVTGTTVSGNSLVISKTKLDMIVGDSLHLQISGNKGSIKWSSSDDETVSVNNKGAVKALKKGSALIVAYVDDMYLTCVVNVESESIDAIRGDANEDGKLNVRDAAFIAKYLSQGKGDFLPDTADFNEDGKINVRDAAAIAKYLASGK